MNGRKKGARYLTDKTDWKIIDILREGWLPNNNIAAKLGVSEGTVRQRLKRLKEAGLLLVRALINPDLLENQQLVFVGINLKESRLLEQKAAEIAELDKVLSASISSGRYDIIVEVLVDSNRGLVAFLTEILPSVEGIASTESFVLLKNYRKFV
jgi:Lrp/AsnC family transcriptional regulator for asnA, asnC and gidA